MACQHTSRGAVTVAQTDFPPYTLRALGDRHFLIAGGGGQAKTGVANSLDVYELKQEIDGLTGSRVLHYDTDTRAVMCSAVTNDGKTFLLAVGMEGVCQLYTLRYKIITTKDNNDDPKNDASIRKRKGKHTQSQNYKDATKTVSFEVDKLESVQTDFDKEYPFQKVVQLCREKQFMATGGADGHLRVWKIPSLEKIHDIQAHSNEIDDIDISPKGTHIVTVSRDNHSFIWNVKDASKLTELTWNQKTTAKYRVRCCRYGIVIDKKDQYKLFTLHIPSKREKKPSPCYITKWETTSYRSERTVSTGTEELSACAISDDGVYLGVGTISGSVSVYISFSLQRLYHVKNAHNIFVTGLEFTPSSDSARAVTGDTDFTMLSISVDNQVKIHQVDQRSTMSALWAIAGFILLIYLFFWLISALGI